MRFLVSINRIAFVGACCALLLLGGCANDDEQAAGEKGRDGKSGFAKEKGDAKGADGVKSDDAKPAGDKPKGDEPGDEKPADGDKAADSDEAADGDKPADGDADEPAGDAPSGDGADKPDAPAEEPPQPVRPDLDIEGQMRLIVDMVNRRRDIRKTDGFIAHFVALADGVINSSDAAAGYKSTALLAKFKVLHEAAVDGNDAAQLMLVKLADEQRENMGRRASEFVRFVDAENKLLDVKTADAATLPKLLEETKAYLAEEELSNRHLRMAQLAVDAVERLPEGDRDAWYKALGEQFERSVDLDLAYVGQRFGKPPVPPSALLGKPFELTGTISSGQELKWENYRDKIVLVDFWATWCTFCIDQEPRLKDIHAKYAGRGLEFVGVSIDTNKEDLTRHLREHEIPWITLFGKEPQEVATKYGVRGVPTLFLIDAEGKILMRSNSIAELEPHIKTHVEALEKKRDEKEKK